MVAAFKITCAMLLAMMRFLRIKSTCVCVISAGRRRDGGKGGEKERETERMAEKKGERRRGERQREREHHRGPLLKGYCPVQRAWKMLEHQESIKENIWENFYIQPEVERRCIFILGNVGKLQRQLRASPQNP